MQSSEEQQEEIRKPSSAINAKIEENNRMGKTRDLFKKIKDTQVGHNKGQKQQGPNRSRRDLEAARIHRRTVQKKLLMTWIIMMVWSLT